MSKFIADFDIKGKKYKVRQLNAKELSESDLRYSATFSGALRNGILTNNAMVKLLIEQKVWTDQEEKELDDARKRLIDAEKSFSDAKTPKKKEDAALTLRSARQGFSAISNRQTRMLNNTAESLADYEKLKYICFLSLANEDGEQVFSDYDDFVNAGDEHPEISEAMRIIMYKQAGADINAKSVEDKYLIEIGRLNKDGYLLNKDGKLVDELGRLIDRNYRFVDKNGYLVNVGSKFVDKDGNEVDESAKVLGDLPELPKTQEVTEKTPELPTNDSEL